MPHHPARRARSRAAGPRSPRRTASRRRSSTWRLSVTNRTSRPRSSSGRVPVERRETVLAPLDVGEAGLEGRRRRGRRRGGPWSSSPTATSSPRGETVAHLGHDLARCRPGRPACGSRSAWAGPGRTTRPRAAAPARGPRQAPRRRAAGRRRPRGRPGPRGRERRSAPGRPRPRSGRGPPSGRRPGCAARSGRRTARGVAAARSSARQPGSALSPPAPPGDDHAGEQERGEARSEVGAENSPR